MQLEIQGLFKAHIRLYVSTFKIVPEVPPDIDRVRTHYTYTVPHPSRALFVLRRTPMSVVGFVVRTALLTGIRGNKAVHVRRVS